jgi:hypothetical protein
MACVVAGAALDLIRDYPQWCGVNRDGAASAFVEPTRWPDTRTRRWRVYVGEGYATPLGVDGTVYLFARRNGNEVMTASMQRRDRNAGTRHTRPRTHPICSRRQLE